jgi:hypothetical protein
MGEPDALIRAHIAWALGEIDDSTARRTLLNADNVEANPEVRNEIDHALKDFRA